MGRDQEAGAMPGLPPMSGPVWNLAHGRSDPSGNL